MRSTRIRTQITWSLPAYVVLPMIQIGSVQARQSQQDTSRCTYLHLQMLLQDSWLPCRLTAGHGICSYQARCYGDKLVALDSFSALTAAMHR